MYIYIDICVCIYAGTDVVLFFFYKVLVLEDLLLFGLSDELAASAAQACLNPTP